VRARRSAKGGWIADVAAIRDGGVRTSDVKVLAARGLTLTEVGYPADDLLGSRAAQTRARRARRRLSRPGPVVKTEQIPRTAA
jgi:hypothetical protein